MRRSPDDKLITEGPLAGVCVTCAGLIRLCAGLDFFTADVEVRRMLVEKLHQIADDHAHAKAIIDHWLDLSPAAPKVCDLRRVAELVRVRRLPDGCSICNGEPWIMSPDGVGMVRCACARGQALAKGIV